MVTKNQTAFALIVRENKEMKGTLNGWPNFSLCFSPTFCTCVASKSWKQLAGSSNAKLLNAMNMLGAIKMLTKRVCLAVKARDLGIFSLWTY